MLRSPVFLAPDLPPPEDPAIRAILEGICKATGATRCELQISAINADAATTYRVGRSDGNSGSLEVQTQIEGRFRVRARLFGAGDGPAASPRAVDALRTVFEGAIEAVVERWNATRHLSILSEILEVTDDGIALVDAAYEIRYANPIAQQALGLDPGESARGRDPAVGTNGLWNEVVERIRTLRLDEGHVRHGIVAGHDGTSWEVELVALSGPGRLGHVMVVLTPMRLPSAEDIRGRLDRFAISRRESEVLALVLTGMRSCEIGERLGISEYTVKDHLKHAYAKLDVTSRTQLVAKLTTDGVVSL